MKKTIVLQSIDSPRRDFEWRLLMAKKLGDHGVASIIGSKTAIKTIHRHTTDAIFFGRLNSNNGRSEGDKKYLDEMEKRGTKIFFIHDEGAFYLKERYEEDVNRIYPKEYLSKSIVERMYFWGESQKNILTKSLESENNKMLVTGHPRFDLCKEDYSFLDEDKVAAIRNKYPPFILVAGRFAGPNKGTSDKSPLSQGQLGILNFNNDLGLQRKYLIESMFGNWAKTTHEFAEFVVMISRLAIDFPEKTFIVRPHPSESMSFYSEAFSHFPNVFINKEGDVRPWIRACDAVIQSECTTGLESVIGNKPTINFRPAITAESQYGVEGLLELGHQAHHYSELKEKLTNILNKETHHYSLNSTKKHLLNVNSTDFAVDIIINDILDFIKLKKPQSEINLYDFLTPKSSLKHRIYKLFKIKMQKENELNLNPMDSKEYKFDDEDIMLLWKAMGGRAEDIIINKGTVFTYF
jgi:surface carbohydrate biosynthesis protein